MINATALVIKGALLGGLGGLIVPALWMALVFGAQPFLRQFTDGSNIIVILTSLISIPFSVLFQGLLEGGLIETTIVGAASGAVVAILVMALRRLVSKRLLPFVVAAIAAVAALIFGLTQTSRLVLATGLGGWQIWGLLALYVISLAFLASALREPGAA
jgi:hypothetical protein